MGTVSDSGICVSSDPGPPAGIVTVTQSVIVTVPMCFPVAETVIEGKVAGGCAGVSPSVEGVGDTELVVKVAPREDVCTGTGVISVNSDEVDGAGAGTGVISVNS